eukprot:g7303.t1
MPLLPEHSGPDRFKATMAAGLKEVETRLGLRRADLDKAWADLDEQRQGVQQRISAMGIVKKAPLDEPTVELNVRGSLVNFRRPVVEAVKGDSRLRTLAGLFDSVWDERLPRDSDGRVVLDESPACVKHLLHGVTARSDGAAVSLATSDAFPPDEKPYLPYVSRALGILSSTRGSSGLGMVVTGGTTILAPDETPQMTSAIQDWVLEGPEELKLLYRASRDGWDPAKFHAACGGATPTISLFRVMTAATGRSYSVIGGYSKTSFAPSLAEDFNSILSRGPPCVPSPGAFVFMLKDGTQASTVPEMWDAKRGRLVHQTIGAAHFVNYGSALRVEDGPPSALHPTSRGRVIETANKNVVIPDDSPFLKLNGRRATEIEVFEVIQETDVSPPPAAKRARSSGEVRLVDSSIIDAPRPMTAQEVSDDLHHFGALVAGPFMEEQTALFHAQTALVQASKRAAASAKALEAIFGPDVAAGKKDDVVELSVRGIRMTTLRSTLQACPESALAARFDREKWAPTDKDLDEDGRQVVDCRPSCFSKVLDVLRMRKRAEWAGDDWKEGWGGFTRVGIKAADRGEFEQFVHIHFPGCERFIMDCVESRAESMA